MKQLLRNGFSVLTASQIDTLLDQDSGHIVLPPITARPENFKHISSQLTPRTAQKKAKLERTLGVIDNVNLLYRASSRPSTQVPKSKTVDVSSPSFWQPVADEKAQGRVEGDRNAVPVVPLSEIVKERNSMSPPPLSERTKERKRIKHVRGRSEANRDAFMQAGTQPSYLLFF